MLISSRPLLFANFNCKLDKGHPNDKHLLQIGGDKELPIQYDPVKAFEQPFSQWLLIALLKDQ
jgi:hypothetical protein